MTYTKPKRLSKMTDKLGCKNNLNKSTMNTAHWNQSLQNIMFCLLSCLLCTGLATQPASAQVKKYDPAKLGPFCPEGSELADAKHTKILSLKEQAQIKLIVKGFMTLDAKELRTFSSLPAVSAYWEKGYTEKFTPNDVPAGSLHYTAYRHTNNCTDGIKVWAILLLDVMHIEKSKISPKTLPAYRAKQSGLVLSETKFWDGISKKKYSEIEEQPAHNFVKNPILFSAISMIKNKNNWHVDQNKTSRFLKYDKNPMLNEQNEALRKFCKSKQRDVGDCEYPTWSYKHFIAYSQRKPWTILLSIPENWVP
jgi:hypothetical protein